MRKMIAFLHVGYAGMGACEALLVEDDASDDEISREAYYLAVEHASSYGYYPREEYEDIEENDCYVDSIEGYAVDYNPDIHDMKRAGGGSFENDFKNMY